MRDIFKGNDPPPHDPTYDEAGGEAGWVLAATEKKLQAARAAFKKLHAEWLVANHRKEMNGGMDGLASALGLDPFTLEASE